MPLLLIALVFSMLAFPPLKTSANAPAVSYTVDNRTPYTKGANTGDFGSKLVEIDGQTAYELNISGSYGVRISSEDTIDFANAEFDIFNASTMPFGDVGTSQMIMLGFTVGENKYLNGEYNDGLTIAVEHREQAGSHTYKLLFYKGFVSNPLLVDANGQPIFAEVTDPANDKLTIKTSFSDNDATFDIYLNDSKASFDGSLFKGDKRQFYPNYKDEKENVILVTMQDVRMQFASMQAGKQSLTISAMRDTTTKAYTSSAAYKAVEKSLDDFNKYMATEIDTKDEFHQMIKYIDAVDAAIASTEIRSYSKNYFNAEKAKQNAKVTAVKDFFAVENFEVDLVKYESAVAAVDSVSTALNALVAKKTLKMDVLNGISDGEDKTLLLGRIAAADAVLATKATGVAETVAADALAKITVANTAVKIHEARKVIDTLSLEFLTLVSIDKLETINTSITAVRAKIAELNTVADWSKHGNTIMTKTTDNSLNFHGQAYSGIDKTTGKLNPANDSMQYDKPFQVTNFSMEFKMNSTQLEAGWFSISLMENKGDIFSTEGEGEANSGKHKGLMIWLQHDRIGQLKISVFTIKPDTTQIYASRKTEDLAMTIPADGKFTLKMFNAPGSNNLSMRLNDTDILMSAIRLPELNNIFGAKTDPNEHKGYLTIVSCVANTNDYFDYEFSKINGKNVFDANIATPDPANVPATEECAHQYDAETGYCTICGELDPNFGKKVDTKKGCGCGGSIAVGGIAASLAALALAFILARRKKAKIQ